MIRTATLLLAILVLSTASASPVITSLSPSSGPASGGTTVIIHGSGFGENCTICSPPLLVAPTVSFGGVPAVSVEMMSSTLLHAVTPASVPGTVSVTVHQEFSASPDSFTLPEAYTFEGDITSAFDPVLFPIFMPVVRGQGGSEFVTTARMWNKDASDPVTFFGMDTSCTLIEPPVYPGTPITLAPRAETETDLFPGCSTSAGRLFFVPKGNKSIAASLRVWEMSRQHDNHGVEIPVARVDEFSTDSIALLDVPTDPKFRLTLRIYGLNRGAEFVNVTYGNESTQIGLTPGRSIFEPSYAVLTDLTPSATARDTMTVLVEVPRGPGGVYFPPFPIWAFITVTNNETQAVTTITPQP